MQNKTIVNDQRIPRALASVIVEEISSSLNDIVSGQNGLVINDTAWYWINPKGDLRPSVVNSANYITSYFAVEIKRRGWEPEKTLNDQRFDGYKEFDISLPYYSLDENHFIDLLSDMKRNGSSEYGDLATTIFQRYVRASQPYLLDSLSPYQNHFITKTKSKRYRVGLEFETGNIASSFRAMQKLDGLYQLNMIDAGVFITSIDKASCSTRIWPVSNRNGSFEELKKRNYTANRTYPSIDIGFWPDEIRSDADYLSEDGTVFAMVERSKVEINGLTYVEGVAKDGSKKYRPV